MVKIVKQLGLFTTILLDQYYTNLENDQRNQRETNCKDIHIWHDICELVIIVACW